MSSADGNGPLRETVVPFKAADGFDCNLIHVQGDRPPTKGPVICVHGAGVRGNIFRAPVRTHVVRYLVENGYDVWLENWRASIDLKPNHWDLDQAAVYDHPAAVQTVVRETGHERIKALIHCQGSTSFMMSAVAGLVPQVTTIVSNAVALNPIVPLWSKLKIKLGVPFFWPLTDYLNPQWGLHAPTLTAKMVRLGVNLAHHECDNPVCKQVSFTYGAGKPALWRHENLNPETHEWLKHEFAQVPIAFFAQMSRCISAGSLVSLGVVKSLPANFTAQPPQTDARFALFAGKLNRCFVWESQVRTHEFLERQRKNYHTLHVLQTYSHLDVFMGKDAAQDIFPLMLAELDKPN